MIAFILRCKQMIDKYNKDEMTVYAAQASFFIIIAAFPFIMLLLTLIQLIPSLSQAEVLSLITSLAPVKQRSLVFNAVQDIFTNSPGTILSITAITALWSASRGMLSMERGLNRVLGTTQKRNYFITRLICAGYTIVFIIICILTMVILVLGTSIQGFVNRNLPLIAEITNFIMSFRALLAPFILVICFTFLYTYVPVKKRQLKQQIPGAMLSTAGWIGFSFAFSIYYTHFGKFSVIYGSLTGIVLLMLWLYVCICILFFGAEFNYFYSNDEIHK